MSCMKAYLATATTAVCLILLPQNLFATALENCPMNGLKIIIERAVEITGADAALQMQVIRRILEDVYGSTWGVLIVKDVTLISSRVHWTIPDIRKSERMENELRIPSFCLHVSPTTNWQYNVFRTGALDTPNRLTIEQFIDRIHTGNRLEKSEFDRRVMETLQRHKKAPITISS